MKMPPYLLLLALPAAIVAPAVSAAPDQRRDSMEAWQARKQGRALSIRQIERRITPQMGNAQYLGFDYDGDSMIYTLKYLRDGDVIWVDVDARSGRVLSRSGR